MEFTKYQHLERLGTTAVDGIECGEAYVFPKLDGTNASIWMDAEGVVQTGSRNRQLELGNDNAGFCAWVNQNLSLFQKFFSDNKDKVLYGEWLVPHSLKTYREDAWRKFYIFDVYTSDGPLHYEDYSTLLRGYGLEYLAPIAVVRNGTDEQFRECVNRNVFLIEEGKGVGEGVVIKNYGFQNKFGRTIWAKVIANHFKEFHHKEMGAPVIGGTSDEEKVVNKYVTPHLVDKVYSKIVNEEGGWQTKFIPKLIHTVYYDLITEEMWEILKELKQPKLDFKFLQRLCTAKVKELKPEVF